MGHAVTERHSAGRAGEVFGFAAKVIGIGIFAGLMITYCQFMIDACFRGLH
jgi:hypothetical protein